MNEEIIGNSNVISLATALVAPSSRAFFSLASKKTTANINSNRILTPVSEIVGNYFFNASQNLAKAGLGSFSLSAFRSVSSS
jgi:hypothetical protein